MIQIGQNKKLFISQADNYENKFGEVFRSSAIFWVKNSSQIHTTISFSNYWKYKNNIDVSILLNLRKLSGELIYRKNIDFEENFVCNYSPPEDFEGSVEIEAFSIKNMRIPYAAIMAIYESTESISMVHSYARAYSQHEIEEKRTITIGEESCWTLRDNLDTTSFSVIHNGPNQHERQIIKLAVRNFLGKEQVTQIELQPMAPFETIIIEPKNYFENLINWLGNKPGNARISFKLKDGFTRMLCGVKKNDDSQIQLTHSNFDYSSHETDKITDGILRAYMRTPNVNGDFKQEIVVYPDNSFGEYISKIDEKERKFLTGDIHRMTFENNLGKNVEFYRTDNILPTRIVTALRLNSNESIVPAECSLGITHHKRPKKHFHWMLVSKKFKSQICWADYQEIYGGCPEDADFVLKLYTPESTEEITKKFKKFELPNSNLIELCNIFDDTYLTDNFCYLSIWCSYGGLMIFSTMEKCNSITIEHSF